MRAWVVSAVGLGVVGALAYFAWPSADERPTPIASHARPVHTSAAPLVVPPRRDDAKVTNSPASAPSPLEPDVAARWASIEAIVRDGDVAALPKLCDAELAKEPDAAPAIIHGVASLAVQGRAADRALAGKTLARWLGEERKRDTRDAAGNVVNIVEALGDLGGDEAVTSLIDVLDHEEDLALQTTAADRLATLGNARALPAVTRFGERLARLSEPTDAFEKELRAEAIKTASDATARLKKESNE